MKSRMLASLTIGLLLTQLAAHPGETQQPREALTPAEARTIAKEATIYGFPLVDNYRVMHSFFVDHGGNDFKAPWNKIHHEARVFTSDDTTIQTPNSDTPYSQLGTDLRAEPLVISVPAVPVERYYSLQFIDLYTHNYAYVGSRATGGEANHFLLAGPNWTGEKPDGVKQVIRSETQIGWVQYRTQLFNPEDIDEVKAVQAGVQGPAAVGLPGPADSDRGAAHRLHQAAVARAAADVHRVLQRPGLRPAVRPHSCV